MCTCVHQKRHIKMFIAEVFSMAKKVETTKCLPPVE